MFLNGHLQIQSHKFTHMAMAKCIFRPENRSYLKDSLKISHHAHLLVELRRLGEASRTIKVIELENIASALGSASNQLRSMDFHEVTVKAKLPK